MLEDRIRDWAADRQRGSGALADEALAILGEAAEHAPAPRFLEELGEVAARLARARPAMVAIENRVNQVMANLHAARAPPEALRGIARGLVDTLRAQAPVEREMAARAAAEAAQGTRFLTVSWSDTAARALELLHARRRVRVVVPQGAPLLDGQRAAERLALAGLEVELVSDAGLGHAALGCDAALVGADAVLAGGVVVNRAGTSLAALAMAMGGRPLWVVCEEAKVTWREALPLEEGDPAQLWKPRPLLPVEVKHVLFDATPAELVRGYATERGLRRRADLAGIAERHERRAAWTAEARRV